MIDIKKIKAGRSNDFSKITSEFEKTANPEASKASFKDDRFWKPERDKAGNASATIRFLQSTDDAELPWVKIFNHGFQGPTGRWMIENCLTTLGKPCPVCELNTKLWNSTGDKDAPARKQVGVQKRKLSYIANILVINDPKHPENNGTVRLFKFGKKIFDMIMDKARPTFEDEQPVNVFSYWDGANFKLRMKTVDRFPNYDSSTWEEVAAIGSDDEIGKVANAQHALAEFMDAKEFKSYDELKAKLETVLSGAATGASAAELAESDEPVAEPKRAPTRAPAAPKAKPAPVDKDDDDMMSYFQSIADED